MYRLFGKEVPGKEVILIRHAQSEAQKASSSERRTSVCLLDAKLHQNGIQHMKTLGDKVSVEPHIRDVQLILCSPLTRAIQTACYVFKDSKTQILLVPELAEFATNRRMSGFENCGRSVDKIRNDPKLLQLEKFKDVDFALVENFNEEYGHAWWTSAFDPGRSRAQTLRLKKLLVSDPHSRIAVVGHCCNFMKLLGTYQRIPNGKPMYCRLYVGRNRIWVVRKGKGKVSSKKVCPSEFEVK